MSTPLNDQHTDFLAKRQIESKDLQDAWQHIAKTKEGQLIIDHMLFVCGVTVFQPIRDDNDRLRKEGRRQYGFGVAELLALDATHLQQRIMERLRDKEHISEMRPNQYNTL